MADQGKVNITMTVPASSAYRTAVSGAGTKSATLRPVGFMDDSTDASTTTGPVQIAGTGLAIAGGVITAGARLKSTAAGALIVATGDATDNSLICAVALEAAASGELFRVKIL